MMLVGFLPVHLQGFYGWLIFVKSWIYFFGSHFGFFSIYIYILVKVISNLLCWNSIWYFFELLSEQLINCPWYKQFVFINCCCYYHYYWFSSSTPDVQNMEVIIINFTRRDIDISYCQLCSASELRQEEMVAPSHLSFHFVFRYDH